MSRQIPEQTIQQILQLTDIAALIGEYVSLKKRGANHTGLCPFHGEKTPSFSVNESKRFYYCFGCHASGDAITFVREYNGLSFEEAVLQLAERVGVIVELDDDPLAQKRRAHKRSERREMLKINRLATEFFQQQLKKSLAQLRPFLKERGIDDETLETFKLGYAPEQWDALCGFLKGNKVDVQLVEKLGLVVRKETRQGFRTYDRFRNRFIFPVFDLGGEVIAFGGRALPTPDDSKPGAKYVNSPDSSIYTKGDVLFGLQQAKPAIRQSGYAILVEGNIDLLRMHQYGFRQAVAPMGTALTRNQAALLRRFTDRVVVIYDGDRAGRAAAEKGLPHWLSAGVDASLVDLPDDEDPDSFLEHYGAAALGELIDRSEPLFSGILSRRVKEGARTPHQKAKIIDEFVDYIKLLSDELERELYLKQVARRLRVDEQVVFNRLSGRDGAVAVRPQSPGKKVMPAAADLRKPRIKAERVLCLFLLSHPEFVESVISDRLVERLVSDEFRSCIETMVQNFEQGTPNEAARLIGGLNDSNLKHQLAQGLIEETESDLPPAQVYQQLAKKIDGFELRSEQRRLQQQIEQQSAETDQLQLELLRTKQSQLMAMLDRKRSG